MRLKSWEYLIFGLQLTTIVGLDLDMVIMCLLVWCQFLDSNFYHAVSLRLFMPLHCYGWAGSDVHLIILFTGSDNSEIDDLRSRKITLERTIIECDESVKALQCELKQIENAEANYHRQRVCWNREKVVSVVCILSVLWKIVMYVFMRILAGSDS